jgi:hypothetical protein
MMRPLLTRRIDRSIAAFHDGKICTKESPIMKMLERGVDEQIAPPRSERDSPTKRMAGPTVRSKPRSERRQKDRIQRGLNGFECSTSMKYRSTPHMFLS